MAAILKLCRQIKNPTPSIDAYLREQPFCSYLIPIRFEVTGP